MCRPAEKVQNTYQYADADTEKRDNGKCRTLVQDNKKTVIFTPQFLTFEVAHFHWDLDILPQDIRFRAKNLLITAI